MQVETTVRTEMAEVWETGSYQGSVRPGLWDLRAPLVGTEETVLLVVTTQLFVSSWMDKL